MGRRIAMLEEVIQAIDLLTEEDKAKEFTVLEVYRVIFPSKQDSRAPSGVGKSKEYGSVYGSMISMVKKGLLERKGSHKTGQVGPLFKVKSSLAHVKKILLKGLVAAQRREKRPWPEDFCISEEVRDWAKKNNFDYLEAHFAAFRDLALARGYMYVDWDAAFRNCIAGDWGRVRARKPESAPYLPHLDRAKAIMEDKGQRMRGFHCDICGGWIEAPANDQIYSKACTGFSCKVNYYIDGKWANRVASESQIKTYKLVEVIDQ